MTALVLLAAALPALADSKPDEKKGDLAKFQGEWKTKLREIDLKLTIKEKKVVASFTNDEGKELSLDGEIALDETATPKRVDFLKFHGPNGNEMKDNLGIYTIEGEKITICLGGAGNDRPTEFKNGDGGTPTLVVLERTDAKPAGDLAKFQGKWKTKLGELEVDVEFADKKVVASFVDGDGNMRKLEGEIVVNDAASPRTIDFVKFKGGDGNEMQDNLGIYRIDDDKITLCLGGPGNARPSEFKAGDGGEPTLLTLEKAK